MVKSEAELASRSLDIPYVEVSAIDGTGIEQVSLHSHACGDDKIINFTKFVLIVAGFYFTC